MKKNWAEIVLYLLLVLTVILAYIDDHDIFTDKNNDDSMYPQLRLPDAGYIQ